MKEDFNGIQRFNIANRYKCELCGTTYGDDMNCETCEASEQEPCNDCVSRAAAMKIYKAHGHDNSAYYIGKLPSVRPIRKEELCDDCVSRKAVLNTLNHADSVLDEDRTVESYKELLMACYNDLPPVTSAPKKEKSGYWTDNGNGTISCSYCHTWFYKDDRYSYMHYCPSCGAEMFPVIAKKLKSRWIPCSVRMPKQNEFVDHVRKYYLVQSEYGDMYVASYTRNGWESIDSLYVLDEKIVAWRPLPAKYKAETEVKGGNV